MGVLQDFERRLEGAVEGFFARAFRSGIQPVELAKALQRYAKDEQRVAADGVVAPNVFRITVGERDHERLAGYGASLPRELAEVVARTASERGWVLRGPVKVRMLVEDDIPYGRFRLAGRVETVAASMAAAAAAPAPSIDDRVGIDRTQVVSAAPAATASAVVRSGADEGRRLALVGSRLTVGRGSSCDLTIADTTVSREHAAFVLRGDTWWVVDLGSTNGTRVNGLRTSEQPLGRGDRIEFGDVVVEMVEG